MAPISPGSTHTPCAPSVTITIGTLYSIGGSGKDMLCGDKKRKIVDGEKKKDTVAGYKNRVMID
jgi:hypothetical protein